MNLFRIAFLFVFLHCPVFYFSQAQEDLIDPENIDSYYLEHLIKKKIDSIRLSKGLMELVNDSVLYMASAHHSAVLAKKRILSHYEAPSKYKNPQKRVEAFGGINYFTGENVARITVYKKQYLRRPELTEYFTYGELATKLVKGWVKSRGHYRNIIKKEYQITGVSIHYDAKQKYIYATQKFAEVKSKFIFIENTRLFPYEEDNEISYELVELKQVAKRMHRGPHRWHLKPRKKFKRCRECDQVASLKSSFHFYVDANRNVHCVSTNKRLFKRLTRRPKDGFALEIPHYRDYECSNTNFFLEPSRRNNQCIANGLVQKPVYKWKLRKNYRKVKLQWNRAKWTKIRKILLRFQFKKYGEAFSDMLLMFPGCASDNIIGTLPHNDSDYYECNILFLKKKRVCSVLQFTDYCGAYWHNFKPTPLLPDLSEQEYQYPEDTLNTSFSISFKQGKSDYAYSDIQAQLDSLNLYKYNIVKLKIDATASVEGLESVNKELTFKRSKSIRHLLDANINDTLLKNIDVREDWEHFYASITNTEFAYLKKLKREEIKKELLNPTLAQKLEPILAPERKAVIALFLIEKVSDSLRLAMAQKRYKELLKNSSEKTSPQDISKLLSIQTLLYNRVQQNKLPWTVLLENVPSQKPEYAPIYLNYVLFKREASLLPKDSAEDRELYTALKTAALKRGSTVVTRYNHLSLFVNHWDSLSLYDEDEKLHPKMLFAMLGSLGNKNIPANTLEQLKLNFYFKAANFYKSTDPEDRVNDRAVNNIYYQYRKKNYNDSIALTLARYFLYFNRDDKAYQILTPYALVKNPNHELFSLYLKIAYARDMYRKRSRFYRLMKTAPFILNREEYCALFTGPCNISMQVFDNEEIRKTWCERCKEFKNFAEEYRIQKAYKNE